MRELRAPWAALDLCEGSVTCSQPQGAVFIPPRAKQSTVGPGTAAAPGVSGRVVSGSAGAGTGSASSSPAWFHSLPPFPAEKQTHLFSSPREHGQGGSGMGVQEGTPSLGRAGPSQSTVMGGVKQDFWLLQVGPTLTPLTPSPGLRISLLPLPQALWPGLLRLRRVCRSSGLQDHNSHPLCPSC